MVLEKQFVVNGFGIKEFNGGKVYLELPRYQSYYNPIGNCETRDARSQT
mgnify:CR=1 FL=1